MTQPGWYADPATGVRRWWDGANWTQHIGPAQAQAAPAHGGLVLDEKVSFTQVHADANGLRAGKRYLAWAEVEWIAYWGKVTKTTVNHFIPAGTDSTRTFSVGRKGYAVSVAWTKAFGGNKVNPGWLKLIEIGEQYLVPRLADDLEARMRAGETVDCGTWVMHGSGLYMRVESRAARKILGDALQMVGGRPVCPVAWSELVDVQFRGGTVSFQVIRNGRQVKVARVAMQERNAVLLPEIASRFRRTR